MLKSDAAANRAWSLRSTWWEPGTSSYFGAARYQTAGDWATFKAALAHWGGAPMNFVYADVDGTIAWQPAGKIPRRPNWDGLTPAPGDGRYEWAGFLRQDELPGIENPARGWVSSANEMNLPQGYPAETLNIGFEWSDPGRIQRIDAVLGAQPRGTVADSAALQTDVFCHAALRGIALLQGLTPIDARLGQALALLAAWDGQETVDSVAAAIVEVWLNKHLAPAIAARVMPAPAAAIVGYGTPRAAVGYLEALPAALGPDPAAARAEILLASLSTTLDELGERLGPDIAAWRWGDLHHIHFVPPAAQLADPDLRAHMSRGPGARCRARPSRPRRRPIG